MAKLANVVVYYDNLDEVLGYIRNLSVQSVVPEIDLIIVVNKALGYSNSELNKLIKSELLNIYLFFPEENLGYLNGLIYGYEQYCKLIDSKPNWIVMSNTDIEFSNNRFFEKFLNTIYNNEIWAVAPSVYEVSTNSYNSPVFKRISINNINRLIFIFDRFLLATIYENASNIKAMIFSNKKANSQYIYSAKGCFFIIKDELAQVLTKEPYGVSMYSEESYIAEIIQLNEKSFYYDDSLEVIHTRNKFTKKLSNNRKYMSIAESLRYIKNQFYFL